MMQEAVLVMEEMSMEGPRTMPARARTRDSLLEFREKIFCLCLGFVGNAADARDLAQETYARALAHYEQDRPDCALAWMTRIARNVCLDQLRRRMTRGPLQPVDEHSAVEWRTPAAGAEAADEMRIVREAIASLPRRQRDVLLMREYGDLSYQEIAAALGIGSGTVMSRLNRARKAVLRFYQEEHHGKKT
jgi:RNA polymerase sigma-70 factor (ECF subfamily)